MLIVIEKDGIASVRTVPGDDPEAIQMEVERLTAAGFAPQIIERNALPASREFRGAWKVGGGKVDVDMPTARTIHMDRIRKARDKTLSVKDVEYMQADEAGNSTLKAEIVAQKQYLRDIPQSFDLESCVTPDELSAAWPPGLER